MSRVPNKRFDYTNKDYEAFRNAMINELTVRMPEYTDLSKTDAGVVILELLAMGLDILSYYQDVLANETFLVTEEQRENALKWCKLLGYVPKSATPAKCKQVFILSSAQLTDTLIPAGTLVKTYSSKPEDVVYFEVMNNFTIPAGRLGNEYADGEYTYLADVIQGVPINTELVGSSNATPSQSFSLKYTPVIQDSVRLYVNEGSGFEQWDRVDSFIDSTPLDKHFTVSIQDNNVCYVTFGDGVFGKIPSSFVNGIYSNYRIGGGTNGNVGANKLVVMDSDIALVSSTFNPYVPYEYGQDRETLDEIKVNAPNFIRTLWGALTIQDFADVVRLNFPKVQFSSAQVNPLDSDSVDIFVLLKNQETLTQDIINEILDFFDENEGGRKIVGADTITVAAPTFVPLTMVSTLIVKDGYSRAFVKGLIEEYLTDFFAVGNYDFNTELSLTELAANVMNPNNGIDGIKSFKFITPSEDVLTPDVNEIYTLNTITINASGGVA